MTILLTMGAFYLHSLFFSLLNMEYSTNLPETTFYLYIFIPETHCLKRIKVDIEILCSLF